MLERGSIAVFACLAKALGMETEECINTILNSTARKLADMAGWTSVIRWQLESGTLDGLLGEFECDTSSPLQSPLQPS